MPEVSILRVRSGSSIQAPLCRLAFELAALSRLAAPWTGLSVGVGAAAALPPVDMSPLLLVAFVGLLWLEEGSARPSASLGLGYAFGFGFFLAGLYWIAAALFVDIATFWWLVPIARCRTAGSIRSLHRLGCTPGQPGDQPSAIARNRPDLSIRRSRGPRPNGSAAMPLRDPWNLIGSTWSGGFPGAICDAADRRLGRHLRVELRDGPCRLTAGPARGVASTADLRRLDAGPRLSRRCF